MSDNRTMRYLAIAYVLLIYATSGWMRDLSTLARQIVGDGLGLGMTTGLVVILGVILFTIHRSHRPLAVLPYLPVLLGYGLALVWLEIPEERFHLLQYGILSLLCSRALPNSLHGVRRHLLAFMLVCLAGAGDELIQWLRPNRVGDLRDIVINAIAALLAQALIAITASSATAGRAGAIDTQREVRPPTADV
ncbi:VanZ family protein [Desulfoprunum benzoelyticum]|uniref:VanZ-like domain-containing protein n=1 Tax=Desulfoprunum benzoelyticum TaxID=1506996 RepID=A0A840V157_9BACT|nr:VanZ family protein [Desulfoprunum benzoelyticum]MBB5347439.1 hypothetical protein [Desulfoprunum benzoelyticum]MBM9529682.1 VanZ family protein [Desulfoprunum benzoelyticum]